jgi:hypothetical protein
MVAHVRTLFVLYFSSSRSAPMRASKSLGELMSSSLKPLVSGSITSVSSGGGADMKAYPTDASEYEVLQECGRGVR